MKRLHRSPYTSRQQGFSLLELALVICIIALLATVWLRYANDAIDDAERAALESIARSFTSSMSSLRGKWKIEQGHSKNGRMVKLDGQPVYVNHRGWPTNTTGPMRKNAKQSPQGCLQLWQAVLQNPTPATLEGQQSRGEERIHISAPDGQSCRYELAAGEPNSHYFDYHLATGRVDVYVAATDE